MNMNYLFKNLSEIKGGLSKKKVFRTVERNFKKIIIDFSYDKQDFQNFINTYKILIKVNISIPKIYEVHSKKKLIVMEDFGDKNFNLILNEKRTYELLKLAVDNLIVIHNSVIERDLDSLEKYTYNSLIKEISEFVDYYIPYKKITDFKKDDFYNRWENIYSKQKFKFNSFVHKDFEFINLIFLDKKNSHLKCGIIDFQSAFLGFIGWDLLSVLEYSRINFTREYNEDLIKYFFENVSFPYDYSTFRTHYYILNLARQTRLLGRWVKLFNEGYKDYLDYIDPTQKRLISCLKNIKDQNLVKIYERVLSV